MLNKISITAMALLLAMSAPAQAGSNGLLLNDDSAQIHLRNEGEPGPLFGIEALDEYEVHQAYSVIYSQEPDPGNFLLSAEIEFPGYVWEIEERQSLTPRVDLLFADFMNYYLTAVAVGASYRLAPSETRSFDIQAEATLAPQLTTFGKGKFLWTFKTQLNYPITDKVQLNFGYRSITMKLLNNYADGFERGLYFGVTTLFE
jgi:hypothetical protein